MPDNPTDWDPPKTPPQTDGEAAEGADGAGSAGSAGSGDSPDSAGAATGAVIGAAQDWDPPRRGSNRRGASAAHRLRSGLAARVLVGTSHNTRPASWPPLLPDLAHGKRLLLWDLRVRSQLAMGELVAGLQIVPTLAANDIASEVQVSWRTSPVLLRITRPSHDRLLDAGPFAGQAAGLAGVEAAMAHRKDCVDAFLDADQDLDLYFMEALTLPVARYPFTFTLLRVALALSSHLTQTMKHAFGVARPHQVWAGATPVIEVPRHGSFPGGHAAQAAAAALVLGTLVKGLGPNASAGLRNLARQVAWHRVVAGLHYPIDSDAGDAAGQLAALLLIAAETPSGQVAPRTFDSNRMPGPEPLGPEGLGSAVPVSFDAAVVQALWALARAEWS